MHSIEHFPSIFHLVLKAFEEIEKERKRVLRKDEGGRIENNIAIFGLDNACYTL